MERGEMTKEDLKRELQHMPLSGYLLEKVVDIVYKLMEREKEKK